MLEFDYSKPYTILGEDDAVYWIQNGRRYLPKSKGPPQLLMQIGAKRTENGGQVMECLSCHIPFKNARDLGQHYKESLGCGEYVKERRNFCRQKSANRINGERALNKILEK